MNVGGVLRMQERTLRFAEVGEMRFVHQAVADGEVMADVELLESLQRARAKS